MADQPQYLESRRLDELARMVTELASEVWILRDRCLVLEHLLAKQGVVSEGALDELRPDAELAEKLQNERKVFVQKVFGAIFDQETRLAAAMPPGATPVKYPR